MQPSRYTVFKKELRRALRLVSDELARRRAGEAGMGTVSDLESIRAELASLNTGPAKLEHWSGWTLPKALEAGRLVRSWPDQNELAKAITKVSELLRPDLP
jgi:hypothetical protein